RRIVAFTVGEEDEGLDVLAPQVVAGTLVVIRYPARGQFPVVVELQVREAPGVVIPSRKAFPVVRGRFAFRHSSAELPRNPANYAEFPRFLATFRKGTHELATRGRSG